MIALLGAAFRWIGRHLLIFLLVLAALVVAAKVYEAYQSLPALEREVAALEDQQRALDANVAAQLTQARAAAAQIDQLERAVLEQRLRNVRARLAAADTRRFSRTGFALDVVQGDTAAIASTLGESVRLQLLQREQAAIEARLLMLSNATHIDALRAYIAARETAAAARRARIAEIERRHPILRHAENMPVIRELQGPWQDLARARRELALLNADRARAITALNAAQQLSARRQSAYRAAQSAIDQAAAPTAQLQRAIADKRAELTSHWATRLWNAVGPVLGWALWITLLVILVPPAVKAFWYFIVAPFAARLRPIVIRPDLAGTIAWSAREELAPGSGVSRRLVLHPGDELIVKPEYLQSAMNEARIDSTLVLSWAIPLGSLATGLVGLTRIRVTKREVATISATEDLFDEVGVIDVPEGAGLIFKPRNLIGVVQRTDRPLRIRSVWRLGHLNAWLTLQLRFLVFEGPCSLIVKGARGVALEPSINGRRIAGEATLGWTPGLAYGVRRSETFLAYLTGKQSLYNDSFEGEGGHILYEEVPRARKGGFLGRGLEGLSDGLLKVMGL